MNWIGILAVFILIVCLTGIFVTCRLDWTAAMFWCVPPIGLTFGAPSSTGMNGLVVLISFLMVFICLQPLLGVRMWNIKTRKQLTVLMLIIFLFFLILIGYCVSEVPSFQCFYHFLGKYEPGNGKLAFLLLILRAVLLIVPLALISFYMTFIFINFLDRFFSKKEKLVLIQCRAFVTHFFVKSYFLEGIHNGEKFYFHTTANMFYILRGEPVIGLELYRGFIGGLYVLKNPLPEKRNKAVKRKRKILRRGLIVLLFLASLAAGILIIRTLEGS